MFVSLQALVVLIVYVLVMIAAIVTSIVKSKFSAGTAIGLLFAIILLGITVYDTHCLTSGSCTAWSWIRTGIYILLPIIGLILWIASFGKDEDEDEDNNGNDSGAVDTSTWAEED
jgi:hypothetical protein